MIVRKDGSRFQLIAGERRWRAAQRAGLEKVPVLVRDVADHQVLEIALVENIQREELNPIEEASATAGSSLSSATPKSKWRPGWGRTDPPLRIC